MKNKGNNRFTDKQVIIGAIIIGFFLGSSLLTYLVGSEDDRKKDNAPTELPTDIELQHAEVPNHGVTTSQDSQSDTIRLTQNTPVIKQPELETDPFEELESLIGLEDVKKEVHSLANFVKVQRQREEQGLKGAKVSYHCVFSGNPGTGKTTVARILARIYKDLGVVSKGHLVETDRSGLIGEYVGQTAPKTNALIDSALGGILFIDEAYALLDKRGGGYGDEAIATLLKRMEDNRDDLVVIVAGYTNEMKQFVNANPGLRSRFTRYIDFADYSAEELRDIFLLRAKKYNYTLDAETKEVLTACFAQAIEQKTRNFGNGRYARNLFEQACTNQANRLATQSKVTAEQLSQLTSDDIIEAYQTVLQ